MPTVTVYTAGDQPGRPAVDRALIGDVQAEEVYARLADPNGVVHIGARELPGGVVRETLIPARHITAVYVRD